MNFQHLKDDNPIVESAVIDFCLQSKPYDFCSIKSYSVKMIQIKKYYQFLLETSGIFYCIENGSVKFFISIYPSDSNIEIKFIFGSPFDLARNFKLFREFYWKQFNCSLPFVGEVKRQHKLKTYLKSIEKRDPSAKIFLDNGKILVSYSRDGL